MKNISPPPLRGCLATLANNEAARIEEKDARIIEKKREMGSLKSLSACC